MIIYGKHMKKKKVTMSTLMIQWKNYDIGLMNSFSTCLHDSLQDYLNSFKY